MHASLNMQKHLIERTCKPIQCLKNINIDYRDIKLIINLYWEQKASFKAEQDISDEVDIERGVWQGCVVSPVLFNLYSETFFIHITNMKGGTVTVQNINNLHNADDTVLLEEKTTQTSKAADCRQIEKLGIWPKNECEEHQNYGDQQKKFQLYRSC